MKWLKSRGLAVAAVIKILLDEGTGSACHHMAARGCAGSRVVCAGQASGREGRVTDQQCVPILERVQQPDPLIYSQGYRMSQRLAVT